MLYSELTSKQWSDDELLAIDFNTDYYKGLVGACLPNGGIKRYIDNNSEKFPLMVVINSNIATEDEFAIPEVDTEMIIVSLKDLRK